MQKPLIGKEKMKLIEIEYRNTRVFSKDELERLFLSVSWSSGHFPGKLVVASDDELRFYENCGFRKNTEASAMCITSLWT